jgi:hypothetical protein
MLLLLSHLEKEVLNVEVKITSPNTPEKMGKWKEVL